MIRVYTKPACVQCEMTKRRLTQSGLPFELDDITDEANLQAALYLGLTSAPVVCATFPDGTEAFWAGFQPDRIDEYARAVKEASVA